MIIRDERTMKFCVKKQIEISFIKIYRNLIFPIWKWREIFRRNTILAPKAYYDRKTILRGANYIGRESFLTECELAYGSYIADRSYMAKTKIGKFCSIGSGVMTAVGNHPIRDNLSSSPSFFSNNPINGLSYSVNNEVKEYIFSNEESKYCVIIENDVWIGTGTVILSGVTIHDGAVIGAGSVVTRDVEAYAIYVGNPAHKIGSRFSESQIKKLMTLQWWNKDEKWIKENAEQFRNVDAALERVRENNYNE